PRYELQVESLRPSSSEITISFPSKSGQSYRLEGSDDLQAWSLREARITGNGSIIRRTIPIRGRRWFLRVREE
ncbi:MAG: hypothetical protein VX633_00340, partial [Verrucomicrobiota bacterium]|nr:hypothetical protein [Verrucomicrobiota bacterium]